MVDISAKSISKFFEEVDSFYFHFSANDFKDDLGIFGFSFENPWVSVLRVLISVFLIQFLNPFTEGGWGSGGLKAPPPFGK